MASQNTPCSRFEFDHYLITKMMTLFLAVHFIIRSQSEEIPSYVYESFVHYTEDFAKSYANEQTKEIAL